MSFVATSLLLHWLLMSQHRERNRRGRTAARQERNTTVLSAAQQSQHSAWTATGTGMAFSLGVSSASIFTAPVLKKDVDDEVTTEASASTADEDNKEELVTCVLDQLDETCDLILEVEGKQLHTSRAVLAHYSPVFRRMLYGEFKEKEQKVIPLPGKQYSDIAVFFNVLYPSTVKSECIINDGNILSLLSLADEYEVEQVKIACQDYIGSQLASYHRRFYESWTRPLPTSISGNYARPSVQAHTDRAGRVVAINPPAGGDSIIEVDSPERQALVDQFLLYLHACDKYDLPRHRENVKQMVVLLCRRTGHAFKSACYPEVPPQAKIELLEDLCRKFETKQS